MTMIEFTVYGQPRPAGSKRAIPLKGKAGYLHRPNGAPIVSVVDDCKESAEWKEQVRAAARIAYKGPLLEGAVSLSAVFLRMRPKSHYRTGRNASVLRDDAPKFPLPKPDVLKLARAVEDALTGVIYSDDAQIVAEHLWKDYGPPSVRLRIVSLT